MEISEQDIFNYVFYPDKLLPAKYRYIKANMSLFERQIKLCENTFSALKDSVKGENRIITLIKKPAKYIPQKPQYYLAADSIKMDKSIRTETYIDNGNNILVKAVYYPDKTKIFLFNEGDKSVGDFRLIIKSADRSFQIDNFNEPVELPSGLDIQNIIIEL